MKRYQNLINRINQNELIILDGGVGTELERRGVVMDASWSGSASLNPAILKGLHKDYINAGADIICTNTYPSSRIMLEAAGFGNRFKEINLNAINSAIKARDELERDDVLVAGSISHRFPVTDGDVMSNATIKVPEKKLRSACNEMSQILTENGCDLIILEMMYDPDRVLPVFDSIKDVNIPVWAGFSARKSKKGDILSITDRIDYPFADLIKIIENYKIDAVGIMHTSVEIITECIAIIRDRFKGPIYAYPDSGDFISPNWIFDNVISPESFGKVAENWFFNGCNIIGGCCGISPEHIKKLKSLALKY